MYDSLDKMIVYDFKLGYGGIGDCIKFFMYLLNLCIKYNVKLHYLINNIPLEKYLKLKYEKMYIKEEDIQNKVNIGVGQIQTINANIYNIITPHAFYCNFSYDEIKSIEDIFYFSNDVIINSDNILDQNKKYISIHLRLGDKFLETEKSYVLCVNDERKYNETHLFNFIENNLDKNIIFFCDNRDYKLKIKNKYNNVTITDFIIGHTSLSNTTNKQVLDAVTDFYIMANSESIQCASYSGFSTISARFKNIPLHNL